MLLKYLLRIFVSTHFVSSNIFPIAPASGRAFEAFDETVRSLCAEADANGFVIFLGVDSGSELRDFSNSPRSCPARWVRASTSRSMNLKNAIIMFVVREESELTGILRVQDARHLSEAKAIFIFVNDATFDAGDNLAGTFRTFSSLAIFNVNALAIDRDVIAMMSLVPFRENECRGAKPLVVNVFNETTKAWNERDLLSRKLRNFHKCPVTISVVEYPPAVMKKLNNETGQVEELYGCDIEVIKGLSTAMNFTMNLAHLSEPYDFGDVMDNRTSGGVSHVMHGDADVALGFFFLTYERNARLSPGYP
jgi:hypothetical protein